MGIKIKEGSLSQLPEELPLFCPVCGRPLEASRWWTVDKDGYYPSLVCYGEKRKPDWLRKFLGIAGGFQAHYEFEMPFVLMTAKELATSYDKQTGKKL